ncbi:MAG: hypothetical protein HY293_00815 [Planctomycetes bacterium]|nr:hypothetical protein [Planctomycetota bacterium]
MGHEIVYCVRCASRVAGIDFERAKAFRVGGKVVCAACLPTLTPAEQKEVSLSSTKMRAVKQQPPPSHGTSVRLTAVPRPETPPPPSRSPLILVGGIGAVVVVVGIATLMLRSTPPPPDPAPPPPRIEPVVKAPAAAPVVEPKEEAPLREAREAIEAARARAKASPNDLDVQIAAWEEAARKAALTPLFRDANAALAELREKKAALKPKEPEKPVVVAPPETPARAPSAEAKAYQSRWDAAMAKASARDFEGAVADLGRAAAEIGDDAVKSDARADADLIQRARTLLNDGQAAISRLPRGQAIALHHRSESGERKQIEGTVLRAGNGRVEIRRGDDSVFIEADDVAARSLGVPGDADRRAFAVLCLLEGDREGAERLAGGEALAPRYWDYAKDAAAKVPRPSPRDVEARNRYYAAEREFAKNETLAAAVAKYKSLAEDYADTRVVKSEGLRIRKRAEAGRDYVFVAGALKGTGTFALAPAPRTDVAWISKANVEGGPAILENYVEAEFGALPETTYRAWALVGGCCAETFTFFLQTTEATEPHPKTKQKTSIDPGSELASVVKNTINGLKKTHEEHKIKGSKTHPKTAARWEWVVIPLPKYAGGGAKKIRLISDQQGFGVGAIVVSSMRSAAMADPELKEEVARVRSTTLAAQDGLVGWWRLDETAGTIASDAVEGGHAGTLVGGPKWGPGKVGGGLKFDTGDEVQVPGPWSLKMITVSAWVRHDVLKPAIQRYVTVGDEAAVIRCQSGGAQFYLRTNGEHTSIVVPNSLEAGKWTHVVGTWDGLVAKLYKDGVVIGTKTPGGTLNGEASRIIIGSAGEEMKGMIDEVRLYHRALSEAEVQKLFADGSAGTIGEIAATPPAPQGKPWRPLFDGTTTSCIRGTPGGWRAANGALEFITGSNDAAQSRDDFGDGELRIRFEVKDAERFWLVFRQGTGGGYAVEFETNLKSLEGKPHDLVFDAKGDQVTATLDGKPVPLSVTGAAKSGCLQFNARGKTIRILSLDVR